MKRKNYFQYTFMGQYGIGIIACSVIYGLFVALLFYFEVVGTAIAISVAWALSIAIHALTCIRPWLKHCKGTPRIVLVDKTDIDWLPAGTIIRTKDYYLICHNCGHQSDIDPAYLQPDDPMPYCVECDQPLINNPLEE